MIKVLLLTVLFIGLIYWQVAKKSDGLIGIQIAAGVTLGSVWSNYFFGGQGLLFSIIAWLIGFAVAYGLAEVFRRMTA